MKIRNLLVALLVALVAQTTFADESKSIFRKVYKTSDDEKIENLILQTYRSALKSSTKNQLQTEVARLQEELDDSGSVGFPEENALFRLSSGKGSATSYGFTYLLGVPVSMEGSGLIEEYGRYVRVEAYLDMAEDTITIDLASMMEVSDTK